ncbi:MAG: hypothetical protein CMA64_09630 [Euryarchaeota archaeon]|jgi:hypothetical protein|nr:hypothetical protein [Euryarchaeota archaeon]
MLYNDYFDIMRYEYSIVLEEGLNDNTNFFAKMSSYAISDRIYKTVEECQTKGYFHITSNNKNINEDLLMLLLKEQHLKKASKVKSPCGTITSYYNEFTNNEVTIDNKEWNEVLGVAVEWQTDDYIRNKLTMSLGGYTLVHHLFNTENYRESEIKKAKSKGEQFDQFVLLPSGLKFAWLLHQLDWEWNKRLVLYDCSSLPIAFAKEMIIDWDGKQPLHEWALEHPVAKSILVQTGQCTEGCRPGAGPREWDRMWKEECEKWGGVENITKTMNKLQHAELMGNISWVTLNIVTDTMGQDVLFNSLENKQTLFWMSNVFDTATIGSIVAGDKNKLYDVSARHDLCLSTYNTLKNKLPSPTFITGSVPDINSDDGWKGSDWKI